MLCKKPVKYHDRGSVVVTDLPPFVSRSSVRLEPGAQDVAHGIMEVGLGYVLA